MTHVSHVAAVVFPIANSDVIGHDVIEDGGHVLTNHLHQRLIDL